METNPIQFLPSRSSQSSGRDPTLIVDLDPGAGKVHLQNSEKQFGAPGGGGFTEEVALDPGLERREGIRCFYRPEKRAGGGRTDRRRSERDRGTHRSLGLSQSREAPGERAARCVPHTLGNGFEPPSLFGSAGFRASARLWVDFQSPADSTCGCCGPTLPDQAPQRGAANFLAPLRKEAAATWGRPEGLTVGCSKGLESRGSGLHSTFSSALLTLTRAATVRWAGCSDGLGRAWGSTTGTCDVKWPRMQVPAPSLCAGACRARPRWGWLCVVYTPSVCAPWERGLYITCYSPPVSVGVGVSCEGLWVLRPFSSKGR